MCILQGTTNLTELFAFRGPEPERINGRLAMIGFVAPLGAELLKGMDLFDQISQGGALSFLLTMLLLYTAEDTHTAASTTATAENTLVSQHFSHEQELI